MKAKLQIEKGIKQKIGKMNHVYSFCFLKSFWTSKVMLPEHKFWWILGYEFTFFNSLGIWEKNVQ